MKPSNRVVVIDAGNTSIKAACFENGELISVDRFQINKLEKLNDWSVIYTTSSVIISSVLNSEHTEKIKHFFVNPLVLSHLTPIPILLKYKTPLTLGIDRICNAVASWKLGKSEHCVSIDIGTCIKFDIVNNKGEYLGGSISPGIRLRYTSLHDYTDNLPLLSNNSRNNLVGNDTETSIQSGVMNGLNGEIQNMIQQYEEQFGSLTFFVTGGDASSFDLHSKNDIFADENLTLIGLYEIYKHNA